MLETSSSLVRGIADFQDHQSWFEFDQKYRGMIRKLLLRKGLESQDLEDAVQETYLSLLSTIQKFQYDPGKGRFRSWISKITQRAASQRHRRAEMPTTESGSVDQPVDDADIGDLNDSNVQLCLTLARSRFDERTWLPFYLRVVEQAPIEEVERITRLNRNAVYQAVHRVKTCLREMLTQFEGSDAKTQP
jgi:RNA polymerase sigma-70 factor (ECF subfamily)